MRRGVLDAIQSAQAGARRVCHVRLLASHAEAVVVDGARVVGDPLPAGLDAVVEAALARDASALVETEAGPAFLEVFNPPLRLFVVGAVHIGQALLPMARALGYAVTLIDPRRAFATEARFPDTEIVRDWPDEALAAAAPDRRTAVVTLTHDPKLDDPALDVALRGEAFYVAALGSRRTHAARLERLAALGHDEAALKRIFGPAGLDIGAVSPAEIALSVVAQMTAALRKPD